MQKFNMVVARSYTDKQGQEKTTWVKIGSAVDNGVGQDGKRKLFGNIDAMPTFDWDGSINLFEQDNQQNQGQQQSQQGQNAPTQYQDNNGNNQSQQQYSQNQQQYQQN